MKLHTRSYGTSGPTVVVLHGGPGAAGGMAPVARRLAGRFRVLEPWQRGSGREPLTVARHVADLDELVRSCPGDAPPALVGSSWGAMLALAYAAEHPQSAGPLVLVGCGTFDLDARRQLRATLADRSDARLRAELDGLQQSISDPDRRLARMAELIEPLYCYESLPAKPEEEQIDARAHQETWDDMLRLQQEGVYPAAFAAIRSPVLMIHGEYDPHPGPMIRDGLAPLVPQLEYRELARCGHWPWREKHAAEEFFALLARWLTHHSPRPLAGEGRREAAG